MAPTVQQGQSAQLTVRKTLDGGGTEPLPANTFVEFYIASGSQAGSLISNDSSQVGDYVSGISSTAIFHARIDPLLPDAVPVIIQVYTDFGLGLGKLVVLKEDLLDHFVVVVERDTIVQGDAVKVSVIPKDQNDNTVTIQDETPLDFSLDEAGASLGRLVTPDGKLTMIAYVSVRDLGTTILTFVANEAPPPALATAGRNAKTSIVSTQSAGTAQATEEPPTIIGVATINVKKTTDPSKKGSAIVTVKKPRFPTKIELTVSSDHVQHSETIVLKVSLRDKDGVIPPGDGVWGINFFLGAEGVQFGNLNNTATGADAVTLNDVPYKQASDGSVTFVADGAAYDGRFPLGISFEATIEVDGKLLEPSVKIAYMKGRHTIGKFYAQSDLPWGGKNYDSHIREISGTGDTTYYSIGAKGCAMSCIAMALKAFGCDVDPGKLNDWMNENDGFAPTGRVLWSKTLEGYQQSTVGASIPQGIGLSYDEDENLIIPSTVPSTDPLEYNLSLGFPSIVQFINPDTHHAHWALVTGKIGDQYTVLDPGNRNRVILDKTSVVIYRYIEVIPK